MALEFPQNSKELTQRSKTDFRNEVPDSNPFLRNSYVSGLITGLSKRVFDLYLTLQQAILQTFANTASSPFLKSVHGIIWKVPVNPATISTGTVVATGVIGTSIPIQSTLSSSDGQQYETTSTVVIDTEVITLVNLIVGPFGIVIATSDVPHNLGSNALVSISAIDTAYDVTNAEITVINTTEFVYIISVLPDDISSGTASTDIAVLPVESLLFGKDTIQEPDTGLTFDTTIPNVDSAANVTQDGLEGGTDLESDSDYRTRLLSRIGTPVAGFNIGTMDFQARQVSGVTRVFIFSATPSAGFAEIYFVRDNDDNIIPSAIDIQNVQDKIYPLLPVDITESRILITGPTPLVVNFVFSAIVPQTATMQTAITNNLIQFFEDFSNVGEDILEKNYEAAITNTVDTATGDVLVSFGLTSPTGAIVVASGELAILGTASFPT